MKPLSLVEIEQQFLAAMAQQGIQPFAPLVLKPNTGKIERFRLKSDDKAERSGWYVLYSDGTPAGELGSWKGGGSSQKWRADIGRPLTQEEEQAHKTRMQEIKQLREAEAKQRYSEGRDKAERQWKQSRETVDSQHPYLLAKGVRAFGLRQLGQGLVIPLRDGAGVLHGLQWINPKKEGGFSKVFGSGTSKAGHYHLIAGEDEDKGKKTKPPLVAIAEGYATGASVRMATGWAVAVAFDAGNLLAVARALRRKLPKARLVFVADDDNPTQLPNKANAGMDKARAAAAPVAGVVLAPPFLPEHLQGEKLPSDWNDYHALCGLEATKAALLAGLQASEPQAGGGYADDGLANTPIDSDADDVTREAADEGGLFSGVQADDRFQLRKDGIYHRARNSQGEALQPRKVAPPLEVRCLFRDASSSGWGKVLVFTDKAGIKHDYQMPAQYMKPGGEQLFSELLHFGYACPVNSKTRSLLLEYIHTRDPKALATVVKRTGWADDLRADVGWLYVQPRRCYDEPKAGSEAAGMGAGVLLQHREELQKEYTQAGTLAGWRDAVGYQCEGNSRLILAVCAGMASLLLEPLGEVGGGFHFTGEAGDGKTTILRVACSLFSHPDKWLKTWAQTSTSVEHLAASRSDALLVLDELQNARPFDSW